MSKGIYKGNDGINDDDDDDDNGDFLLIEWIIYHIYFSAAKKMLTVEVSLHSNNQTSD